MIKNKIIFFSLIFTLISFISACSHRYLKDQYLYDRIGFSPGSSPEEARLNNINPVPPAYYFRSDYNIPSSRYYSNPYDIPNENYQRRYDSDSYYIVPDLYGNDER